MMEPILSLLLSEMEKKANNWHICKRITGTTVAA